MMSECWNGSIVFKQYDQAEASVRMNVKNLSKSVLCIINSKFVSYTSNMNKSELKEF